MENRRLLSAAARAIRNRRTRAAILRYRAAAAVSPVLDTDDGHAITAGAAAALRAYVSRRAGAGGWSNWGRDFIRATRDKAAAADAVRAARAWRPRPAEVSAAAADTSTFFIG